MGYTHEAFEKAEHELSSRRHLSSDKLVRRYEEVSKNVSGFKDIDDKIAEIGIELSKLALKKGAVDKEKFFSLEKEIKTLEQNKQQMLESAGFGKNYFDDVHICNVCKDTGYINGEMCSCFKKLISEYEFNGNSVYENVSFDNFNIDLYSDEIIPQYNTSAKRHMQNVYDFCKAYADEFTKTSENIIMFGGAGLGKTFMCTCIAKELSRKGFSVIMQSAYNIFEIISKNKFSFKTDLTEDVNKYYNCDLLIMDDLGTEFVTEYTVSALFDIINTRMVSNKPTIINANLSLKNIEAKYSDRIVSRLLTYNHLLFLGTDIRSLNI